MEERLGEQERACFVRWLRSFRISQMCKLTLLPLGIAVSCWRFLSYRETCIRTFLFFFHYVLLGGQGFPLTSSPYSSYPGPHSLLTVLVGISDYWMALSTWRHVGLLHSALWSWRQHPVGTQFPPAVSGLKVFHFSSLSRLRVPTPSHSPSLTHSCWEMKTCSITVHPDFSVS